MFFTSTVSKLIVKGAFWRTALLFAGMFVLLSVAGLSSSSEADEPLFTRSAQQLERLWSGVLGCTHPGEDGVRGTFETTFNGGGAPSAVDHDYVECGKRALRNTSSHMLVDTIEDAVRSGGVALFSENFHLDSSVGWVWDEKVSGEFDAVIPLFSKERYNGLGYAFFLQPGGVFWQGLKNQDRIDGNLGLAFRSNLTRDIIAGGSVFYDYDFRREHQRAGVGLDLQSGALHTALNYYHPLNDWQEGRTDYEEQPLQGADFRLGLAWSRIRFDTSVAVWRFEGEEEESTKWRPSFGVDAGYRILPGVFLEGGYESHDSDDSLDSRWNAGLAFRFSLPGLKGVKSYETMAEANLWEPVAREKRILYEEREAIPIIRLVPTGDDGQPLDGATIEEGGRAVIVGQLVALPMPVTYELAIDDTSTAELGVDFIYGHRVYELDEETGEQSAPEERTDCPEVTCEMTIPAEITRFEVEVELLDETETAPELQEEIVLRVNVPEEHQRDVRSNETRVTIEANNNVIMFDGDNSSDELMEANGSTAEVAVAIDLPSPTPIQLTVTPGGEATQGQDYNLSPPTLLIPANASSASLVLSSIDDSDGEGHEDIELTLSGSLPPGWDFGPSTDPDSPPETITHTVTLLDDDLVIGFEERDTTFVEEDAGTVALNVIANLPLPDVAAVEWSVTEGAAYLTGTTSGTLNFSMNDDDDDPQTITVTLAADDSTPEDAQNIIITLDEASSMLPEGWAIGTGTHTITIEPSDGAIAFTPTDPITANEGDTVQIGLRSTVDGPSSGYPLTISIPDGPNGGNDIDFPATVSLPAGQKTHSFSITIRNDGVSENEESFTMSLGSGASAPAGWTVSGSRTITIPRNEARISFADSSASAVEVITAATTTLIIAPPPTSGVTVPITVTAAGEDDYVLEVGGRQVTNQITVGTSGRATLTLRAFSDLDQVGGSVTVRLGTPLPQGYEQGSPSSWVVTITDDNTARPTVAFAGPSSVTALEGGSSVTVPLIVSPAPSAPVEIPVTIEDASGSQIDYTLQAGSTAITGNSANVTVDTTGRADLSLTVNSDSDGVGGRVTVAIDSANLPSGYMPPPVEEAAKLTRVFNIHDDTATEVEFAMDSLTYSTSIVSVNIVSDPSMTAFPEGVVLVVENSDETNTVLEAGPQAPLKAGETRAPLKIRPLGGTAAGDVVLTLTDPHGTLPFAWRIGDKDTLTLTRQAPPSANTINLSGFTGGNVVVEGSQVGMVVDAVLPSSGGATFPAAGIDLSLTVTTNLEDMDETSADPNRCPQYVPVGNNCVDNFEVSANLSSANAQGFKREGRSFPFFPSFDPTPQPDSTRKYTFTLVQEPATTEKPNPGNPSANIFALIPTDIGIEPEETITVTLAAEGTLPNGWTLGSTTYEITVPRNGERIGFASNLPTRTWENSNDVSCPTPFGALSNEIYIRLPFETLYDSGTQNTFDVSVTGTNHNGTPVSNIYNQVEVTGQVNRSTRKFSVTGNGRMQTTDIGIFICSDNTPELAQTLTVKVDEVQSPAHVEVGNLEHIIIVAPSDNTITFQTPVSRTGATGVTDITANINMPIPVQTKADMDNNISLPSVLIKRAASNEALPTDYTLSVSAGELNPRVMAGQPEPENRTWTLPTAAGSAMLTVTSNVSSGSKNLVLEVSALNPLLGWDVSSGTHTITVPLGP